MSTENTIAASETFNDQDLLQPWDELAWGDLVDLTLPSIFPADQAGYNSCLQEQMVTLTPPTSSPQCLAGNDSNSTSAPISPTGAVRNGGRSKKRKYGDIEDGNVQTKERVHDGPRRIEDLSGPEHQKLQELIEAARDEMVQLQQEVKRLGARILELEQGRESQGRSLTKAPAMTEECKDMPGFRRGWVAALQSINW